MTKKQLEQKIKEILLKDKRFKDCKINVIYKYKRNKE
jgi:hypothetical protein